MIVYDITVVQVPRIKVLSRCKNVIGDEGLHILPSDPGIDADKVH